MVPQLTVDQKRSLHVLGFLFLRMGQFARARRLFAAIVAIDPEDINARLALAHAAIKLEDGEMALHALQGIVSLDNLEGGNAIYHLLLARAYDLVGESSLSKEAISAYWNARSNLFKN